ncbi:MAG TPA: sialidase family protein [Gaiellaceae bacterium]|nr:sialidase family protein [Gaiellaceae bacterium]
MGRRVILVAAGALALLAGTAGAAVINGTKRADFLRGGPRPDRIDGRAGNDRIKVDGGGRDTVRCGGGADLVNADASDRVARDCETVARVIARDPYAAPAQHSTIAEPDSLSWGNKVVATFQVGRFEDGGAVSIGWATSSDAGRTWRSGRLPALTTASRPAGPWPRASDPVVAYDAIHGVWLIASLALSDGDAAAIVVSRSTDGLSWSAPATVTEAPFAPNLLLDKEWIVCDNGPLSPHRGSCYATYSDFRTLELSFQTSHDGGLTWEEPVGVPENAGRASMLGAAAPAPQPLVQPDGDLIVPYYDEDRVASLRSSDGGRSFEAPVTVAPTQFKGTRGLRAPPLPSAEIDRDGTVYVVWPDCGRPCGRDALVLSRSTDGVSWSAPLRIPLGSGADFVIPGLAADVTRSGRLALAYYAFRPGPALDVGFTTSANGGRRWSAPRRLNAQTMPLAWVAKAGGAMVGDYMSTSFAGGRTVPVFVLASRPGGRFNQPLFAAALR